MNEQSQLPTSDERIMAALSHFFGLIVALILWATQKDKSRYVRFQAVQAMAFDLVVMISFFIVVGCMMITMVGSMALGTVGTLFAAQDSGSAGTIISLIFGLFSSLPFVITCPMFIAMFGVIIIRLIAAINAFQGNDFHYPWLGERVERFLNE